MPVERVYMDSNERERKRQIGILRFLIRLQLVAITGMLAIAAWKLFHYESYFLFLVTTIPCLVSVWACRQEIRRLEK